MKLIINAELPVSPENEGLIQLVAMSDGWTSDTQYKTGVADDGANITESISASKFVTDFVIKEFLQSYISGKVSGAYGDYFGKSKEAEKKALTSLVLEKLTIDVQFINDDVVNPIAGESEKVNG